MLRYRHVSYAYGEVAALDDVSFDAREGEIVGLIGENGAGKSTALRLLMGFLTPDRGEVLLSGRRISSRRMEQHPVSYIPDTPVFYEELSVLEHLQFVKALYPGGSCSVRQIMAQLELEPHRDKIPSALSKGTRQKLMIAMALLRVYQVLVADEPFSGLDPRQIAVLKGLLLEQRAAGKLVLLSSHLLDVVENVCDRYVALHRGRVLAAGSRDALLDQTGLPPDSAMEDVYLALMNRHES